MARITVEDCLKHVDNRFGLVLIAAKRARQLERTSTEPKVHAENDKPTVLALREIAAGYVVFNDEHTSAPALENKEDLTSTTTHE